MKCTSDSSILAFRDFLKPQSTSEPLQRVQVPSCAGACRPSHSDRTLSVCVGTPARLSLPGLTEVDVFARVMRTCVVRSWGLAAEREFVKPLECDLCLSLGVPV